MNDRALRSVFWLLLVSLIAAQTPAVEPVGEVAPQQPTVSPTPPVTSANLYSSNLVLPSGSNIAVIPVTGVIYDFTFESLQRRVDKALAEGATLIVIELDTPGGVATSAMKISKYIRTIPVPTVAWVHNEAYSAGIMIAAACDEIVMSPASSTGDCAPIIPGMNLAPTERAKALSPILEEFRDSAQDNGYDFVMFQAMCVLGVEVYMVEKTDGSGERRLVNQIDYAVMVKGDSPQDYASQTPPPGAAAQLPAVEDVGAVTLSVATDADRGAWRAVEVLPSGDKAPGGMVHDGKTLLTRNQKRAADIGLSKATIATQTDLQKNYRAGSVVVVAPTWSEGLAAVLTSWWARIILIIVCLIGGYIEMQAPGLSVPGAVAAAALLLLIGAAVHHRAGRSLAHPAVPDRVCAGDHRAGVHAGVRAFGYRGPDDDVHGDCAQRRAVGQGRGRAGRGLAAAAGDVGPHGRVDVLHAAGAAGKRCWFLLHHQTLREDPRPQPPDPPDHAALRRGGRDGPDGQTHTRQRRRGPGRRRHHRRPSRHRAHRATPLRRRTLRRNHVDVVSVGPFIDKGDKVQVVEVRGNRIVVDQA
ncbi:MAG: hypothetical protein R3C45_20025 [Phycisphaerales bacterium]